MGSEQLCTVRSGGKTSKGEALLEASEIIFRGDFRLKIPLSSLQSTVAKDGELRLKWADGSAIFELGDRAAKWADKILHPKSTAEKLGIKPELDCFGARDSRCRFHSRSARECQGILQYKTVAGLRPHLHGRIGGGRSWGSQRGDIVARKKWCTVDCLSQGQAADQRGSGDRGRKSRGIGRCEGGEVL